MKRNLGIVVGIMLLVVVAGGSFYGGMVYGKGQAQPAGAGGASVGAFGWSMWTSAILQRVTTAATQALLAAE